MRDAEHIGILLPLPLALGGKDEQRAAGRIAFQFLDGSNGARAGQFRIEDRGVDRPAAEEKFRLADMLFDDDLELAGIEHGLDGGGHAGLVGED